MELLPVALHPAADPVGPAAGNFLAGDEALGSPSAHPAGRLLAQDTGDNGAAAPLGLFPREQDSGLGSLPRLGQALPALEENFSVVWLSAVQMTELQPPAGPRSTPPSEDPSSEASSSENPSITRGSGPAAIESLAAARQAATAVVRQAVLPASPLTAFVQAAIATPAGGQPNANVPVDGRPLVNTADAEARSVAAAEITKAKPNSGVPALAHDGPQPEGLSRAAGGPESGMPKGQPLETGMALPVQLREVEESGKPLHQDNAAVLKVLNIGQRESEESPRNEAAPSHAERLGDASRDLKTDALQEAPAAEGLQRDLPAIETLKEEGQKLREAISLTEKPLNPPASPASPSPLLSMARGSRNGDSSKTTDSRDPHSASQTTAAANVTRLPAMPAKSAGQEPSAAETAFKAEIRSNTAEGNRTPAASDADAVQPALQGQQRAAANLSFRSVSSAAGTREAEPLLDAPISQPGNLPVKPTTSYIADLPASPQPLATNGVLRQSTPTAPAAAEVQAAELEPARPSTKQAGDVTVQLRSEEHGTANIRFREHAGQVQVTVRAADPQLVQSLRSGLDQLKSGLDTQGFQTTIWSGGSSSAASRRGDAEGSLDTYHRAHEEPSGDNRKSHDHSGHGNQQAEEWMDEIE
jgi:hypothetical protein